MKRRSVLINNLVHSSIHKNTDYTQSELVSPGVNLEIASAQLNKEATGQSSSQINQPEKYTPKEQKMCLHIIIYKILFASCFLTELGE